MNSFSRSLFKQSRFLFKPSFTTVSRSNYIINRNLCAVTGTTTEKKAEGIVVDDESEIDDEEWLNNALREKLPFFDHQVAPDTIVRGIRAFSDNYIWFLHHGPTGETAVIDPGDAAPVIRGLKEWNWKLDYIFATHHHPDHIGGITELRNTFPDQISLVGGHCARKRIPNQDVSMKPGEEWFFQDTQFQFEVIETPGHTLDHVSFRFPDLDLLFCGDTLFSLSCGKLFEGTPAMMWDSMKKIRDLPNQTLIFCGHEYTRKNAEFAVTVDPDNQDLQLKKEWVDQRRSQGIPTLPVELGLEKKTNPFLRADYSNLRHLVSDRNLEQDPVEVFAKLRTMKDGF